MKKIILLIFLSPFLCAAQTQIASPYCNAPRLFVANGAILNVSLGSLNNTTPHFPGNSFSQRYTFFNNLAAPVLYLDSTYTLSITFDTIPAVGNEHDRGWYYVLISFDSANTIFSPVHGFNATGPVEDSAVLHPASDTPITKSFLFTVPHDAQLGLQRMRIIRYGVAAGSTAYKCYDASKQGENGETEDYSLEIRDIPPPDTTIDTNIIDTTTFVKPLQKESIAIYPNPVTDILHFPAGFPFSIFNVYGKRILTGQETSIDVSLLPSGLYYLRSKGVVAPFQKQ